jgi:3-oxoacyl-[acyl-carrier protein] reductase
LPTFKEAIEKMGSLDILINNAGILGNIGNNIETTTLEQWELVMNTNLRSVFLISQVCSMFV